jgi:hypothetical protein
MTTQDNGSTTTPAKATKAPRVTITEQLYALFDQVGEEALSMGFAQDLAVAHGFNRTSAGISFCRWRQLRTATA